MSRLTPHDDMSALNDIRLQARTVQHPQPHMPAIQSSAPRKIGRVDLVSASRSKTNESFAERQIVHFAMVLGRKWACIEPEHEMCFTGQGKHIPLTDDMIMAWVTALCNGEATTHIPPFALEESGSDSDAQPHSYPIQGGMSVAPNTSASSISHVDASPSKTIISSPSVAQSSHISKTVRKYSSSSRISTTSSFSHLSSASQNSRVSSVSTSSWNSAGTGTGTLASSATSLSEGPMTPVSPPTNAAFSYPPELGSSGKPSTHPAGLEQSSPPSFSNPSRFASPSRPPYIPSPVPLSPPFSALPSPPIFNQGGIRPDSPVHSLISELPERLSVVLQTAGVQQQVPSQGSTPQQGPHHHTTNPYSPPPRPPRNHNRPLSPEPATQNAKHFEHPRTPPRSPPQHAHMQMQASSTGSGVSSNKLRSPHLHPQAHPSSSSVPHSQLYSSYLYPTRSTHLTHVREEEERPGFESELSDRTRERRKFDDSMGDACGDGVEADVEADADAEVDPESDVQSLNHATEIEHDFDHPGSRYPGGVKYSATTHEGSDGDIHHDFDRGSIGGSEGAHGGGGRSIWSPYTSFLPSLVTAPGNGKGVHQLTTNFHSNPSLISRSLSRTIPDQPPSITSTVKTKWIESASLAKRAKSHLSRIKKWRKRATTVVVDGRYSKRGKEGAQVGILERSIVIEMIGDGVEMARSCYPPRIHKMGYELGKEVQQWLQTFTDNDPAVLYKKENVSLLTTVQTCFLPILLMRLADIEPSAATLAGSLVVALTKVPLSLHENEAQATIGATAPLFTSLPTKPPSLNRLRPPSESKSLPSSSNSVNPLIPHRTTSISSIAVHIVARELGSTSPICPSQHSWLGMTLLKIVEMTMKIRHLSVGELEDIRAVARKKQEEYQPASYPPLIDTRFTRPWEVALFALCAITETAMAPFFRRMVLGPMGIPLLIKSLDSLLASNIDMDDVKWEDVGLTLRALAFLSEHAWVIQGMSDDGEGKDMVEENIKTIMLVFWRSIPERWFSIRFWAMDAVRNFVSHRPPLVRLLADIKADKAFLTLTPSSPLYPSAINTSRMSVEGGGKVRNKMLEEYRKESAKRAEEMVDYIRMWYNVTEGGEKIRSTVVLQPVAINFDGR